LGASIAVYVSPGGTEYPSEKSLKWWMSASMDSFMLARGGGTILLSSILMAPVGILLRHWRGGLKERVSKMGGKGKG
jgi:hypothetical protein